MTRWIVSIIMTIIATSFTSLGGASPAKIAIIKADDIRGRTAKWDRFFSLSKEKGVKVSAGIICNSLQGEKGAYFDWLKHLQTTGCVEFWNHGWDHKRWNADNGKQLKEFSGSGYDHQKEHFEASQKLIKKVLGIPPIAFGAPFNAMDADTIKVIRENPDMRLFFCYGSKKVPGKVSAPMNLRGENNGTGKPDFTKFKVQYDEKKDLSFAAIQFHPNGFKEKHFIEYAKILDFLIAEGWTFMLPAEYVAMVDQTKN